MNPFPNPVIKPVQDREFSVAGLPCYVAQRVNKEGTWLTGYVGLPATHVLYQRGIFDYIFNPVSPLNPGEFYNVLAFPYNGSYAQQTDDLWWVGWNSIPKYKLPSFEEAVNDTGALAQRLADYDASIPSIKACDFFIEELQRGIEAAKSLMERPEYDTRSIEWFKRTIDHRQSFLLLAQSFRRVRADRT